MEVSNELDKITALSKKIVIYVCVLSLSAAANSPEILNKMGATTPSFLAAAAVV